MTLGLIGAIVSACCALVLVAWMRRASGTAETAPDGPRPWTIVLRIVGDEDEELARSLVGDSSVDGAKTPHLTPNAVHYYGGDEKAALARAEVEAETVVDLLRLAPSATHYYAGAPVPELRCDLSGGYVLRVDTTAAHPPVENLADVLSLLQGLPEGPTLRLREARLGEKGRFLFAVDESARPGHRLCEYCRQSYIQTELECPNCGAAATL